MDHGIISHRTPPYTPQHNGVSESRNQTLLDMVRSMMSQTTLPKSFWDYAIKSAAHILNMVPTKKVDKTLYESTSLDHEEDDQEIDEPQSDINPIRGLGEPANYKAALLDPESDKWLNAMNVEMQSMKDNEVWELVDLPPPPLVINGSSKRKPTWMEQYTPIKLNPGEVHWTAIKNILKYLPNTKDMFLVYGDAEYIAAFDTSKEAVWIRKFIYGLGVVPTIEEPINMYCDNTGAIAIAKDHGVTKGARIFT
ncbi:retrovirus-related pol polyprotein from transposon TNT 1-94 [Tanacetum coccineum]|uniref:Retrovirus-related pol polyprotein from transposon TNT 1-94 n=1 Tax=Tanacetum coccineum TaxID=301880 RepID=A0ABQ4XA80_9ASTR